MTLCVLPVSPDQASGLGILKMERSGQISRFCEKPQEKELVESLKTDVETWRDAGVTEDRCLLASMGIYLFNTEVLVKVLEEEPKMDFGRDIIPNSLPNYKVSGYVFNGYWEDIGTIAAFYEANLGLTVENPQFSFYVPEAPIYSHPRFLPASRIVRCDIRRSILSEGCEVADSRIADSVIGIRSIIRSRAQISRTLMLGADYYEAEMAGSPPLGIGPGCVIEGAILDKNARIGADVQIVNRRKLHDYDGDNYFVRDGIVVIPKNAQIPDGTVI
jgi:glucose-1-phosphate adenylyltransferase